MNLYELLPSIYRRRDAELFDAEPRALESLDGDYGDDAQAKRSVTPLKALLAILQSQYDLLERDMGSLYDDWFVETCSPEMLARLAEPLGIDDLDALLRGGADARAIVANVMRYRSEKGGARAFESYARDATGWKVRIADRIATTAGTSRVEGISAARPGYPDLRRGAFKTEPGPRITGAGARYGIAPRSAQIDVFRVRAMLVTGATPGFPRTAGQPQPTFGNRRTFSPVGDPKRLMRPTGPSGAGAVPYTRADARAALATSRSLPGIAVGVEGVALPPERLQIADLSQWAQPRDPAAPQTVLIDPELGRLLLPAGGTAYTVDYWQAMNDGIGASPPAQPWSGAYDRTLLVAPRHADDAGTSRLAEARIITRVLEQPELVAYQPLRDADRDAAGKLRDVYFDDFAMHWAYITAYALRYGIGPSVSRFMDTFASFELAYTDIATAELITTLAGLQRPERASAIEPRAGDRRTARDGFERMNSFTAALRAAESASGTVRIVLHGSGTHAAPAGGWTFRAQPWLTRLSVESAPRGRPTVTGTLRIVPRQRLHVPPLAVELRGLNIGAQVDVTRDVALTIASCTLRPPTDENAGWSIGEAGENENAKRLGTIRVVRSIVGGARLGEGMTLAIEDSIVTDPIAPQPGTAGPKLDALRSTFLADVEIDELTASDALFDANVTVRTRSAGYARYCAARPGAQLPVTYRCVPPTARRLLASAQYGHERFARLRHDAPASVRAGSSSGSEIGAFGTYGEALRSQNLHRAIDEYVPDGVTPHVVYRT